MELIRPERVRSMERPFGWVPFRLLSSGLLAELTRPAKLLYFFLCLVADRHGLSFYGDARLYAVLGLSEHDLERARAELVDHDLLAFDGRNYQLLSLPPSRRSLRSSERPKPPSPPPRFVGARAGAAEHLQVILQRLAQKED